MLIKFKSPDPRAGMTARMDSSRGQHFIDAGAAVEVKEHGSQEELTPVKSAAAPPARTTKAAARAKK